MGLQSLSNMLIVNGICYFCSCKVQEMIIGNVKIISLLVTLQLCNRKVGFVEHKQFWFCVNNFVNFVIC